MFGGPLRSHYPPAAHRLTVPLGPLGRAIRR